MKIIIDGEAVEIPGGSGGGESAGEAYSTEETRIGTWIDGKPLYRKVFRGSIEALGVEVTVAAFEHGIDTVHSVTGIIHYANEVEHQVPSSFSQLSVNKQARTIRAYVSTSATGAIDRPIDVTVEYTKTTD